MNKLVRCENYRLCDDDECEHYRLHTHTQYCDAWCAEKKLDCIPIKMEDFIKEEEMEI